MRWDKEKLYIFFDNNFYGLKRSTGGWYTCECPVCGKEKLAVNFKYMQVKCWRGCYNKMFIPFFLKDYLEVSYKEAHNKVDSEDAAAIKIPKIITREEREGELMLPPGYKPILSYSGSPLGREAYLYLKNRGFDMNYLDMLGVGFCDKEESKFQDDYFGYIIIPFKRFGKLIYFIGRDFIGNVLRYKNPPAEKYGVGKGDVIFNSDALYMEDKVYMTEGWGDASTIGRQGISTQGLDLSVKQRTEIIKSPVKEVIIIPDAGAYKSGLKSARHLMSHKKVRVMCLDDFQDRGEGDDVNKIGWDKIKPLQYDFPILTSHKWYRLMREAQ